MDKDVAGVLIDEARIRRRITTLAGEIAEHYSDRERGLTIVPVLSGSIVFLADLIRQLPVKMRMGLVHVSSYRGETTTPRDPRLIASALPDLRNQDVLIVDDILDTGGTLRLVQRSVGEAGPRSLRTVVLLRKPRRRDPDVAADFVGFDIENVFVVGYGLDYNGWYRNLPYIAVLTPDAGGPTDGPCG